jgi:hypothetical protein
MPPSMQISAESVTVYGDLLAGTKRASLTFTSADVITLNSGNDPTPIRLTNLSAPSDLADATNKQYVDTAILGLKAKQPVRVVSLANGELATAYAAGQTVDGITLVLGDRILLAAQTDGIENGIYVVTAEQPTRSTDVPAAYSASGTYVFVDQGTVSLDRSYICISDKGSDVVGTNALQWVQFGARPSAMAGDGLVVGDANELDVNVGSGLTIIDDKVRIADKGVVNAHIDDTTIQNAKLVNPQLTVTPLRGLLGAGTIQLGGAANLEPDFTVLPDLAAANTFTGANTFAASTTFQASNSFTGTGNTNTFQGIIHVTNTTAATSQTSGAVVIDGGLAVGGDLYTSNSYNMSDQRLKTDLVPIENALDAVSRMTGYAFTWNAEEVNQRAGRSGGRHVGVMAQDVEAVAPLCVTKTGDGFLAVEYTKIVPYLIEACKTLRTSVDTLTEELGALKRAHASEDADAAPAAKRARA